MKKIAVLGGTFDPIHFGHLIIAEEAYQLFSLEKVIFMPTGQPPHKDYQKVTSAEHRWAMLKLAIQDNPHFACSDYEIQKKGKSYTADTLRYLKSQNLAEEIFFIIGSDSFLDLKNWREVEYLMANGKFIIAQRPGYLSSEEFIPEMYRPYRDHFYFLNCPIIDISATGLRRKIRQGFSIKYQTRDDVIAYIEKKGLYRGD